MQVAFDKIIMRNVGLMEWNSSSNYFWQKNSSDSKDQRITYGGDKQSYMKKKLDQGKEVQDTDLETLW